MSPLALALVGWPLAAAAIAAAVPWPRVRPWVVLAGGLGHTACSLAALAGGRVASAGGWIGLNPVGSVVLVAVTSLFLVCALYAPGYLAARAERDNRLFCAGLLGVLAAQTLAILAHHLGLLWLAMETATLATAPLVYFNRSPRSLEATWKYLVIGGVGIAVALLGSFFLAYAALKGGLDSSLLLDDLVRDAPRLSKPWLHAAFVLLLVGYGTKMGLAPMHTWKPDAYGEAPGMVGTMLSGGLTSCAFLAVLRFFRICAAAGEAAFARELLLALGLLSMAVAAVFMARQRDFKRMLAYSSVEHMGILVLGVAIGGAGLFGAFLHLLNNALGKAVLFLSAGNIHRAHGSKLTDDVRGALHTVPFSAGLFLAGFLAITGSPPFGPFLSEFTILSSAFRGGSAWVGAAMLSLLFVIFCGMGATVLAVVHGAGPARLTPAPKVRESFATVAPVVLALAAVLLLGLHVPRPLEELIHAAVRTVGGQP